LVSFWFIVIGHPDTQDISLESTSTTPQESPDEINMDVEESIAPTEGPPVAPSTPVLPHRRKQVLQSIKFAAPIRITSRRIYEVGGGRAAARAREAVLRLPENADIPQLHGEIAKASILQAQTLAEVDKAHAIRSAATTRLRAFESSNKLIKNAHHREIQTKRSWQTVAAQERNRIRENLQRTYSEPIMACNICFFWLDIYSALLNYQ
jgi:hypothetical protein